MQCDSLATGAIPSPFDCYLAHRGLKTLHLRMQCHMSNALAIATWLENDSRVERVFHPELPSHPQRELHKKQASGMCGVVSFKLNGGLEEAHEFLLSLKVCQVEYVQALRRREVEVEFPLSSP